jgi:2-dehydropantoate 2-reductase
VDERVQVVGAGALGCILAAAFSRVRRVRVVARGATADALRAAGGIRVRGLAGGLYPVEVRDRLELDPEPSVVLLTVKAYDLEPVLRALAPQLAVSHLVVVLQNGLGIRALAAQVLGRDVIRGVTFLAANRSRPGEVEYNAAGKTYLPAIHEVVRLWDEAGLPVQSVDDVRTYVWRKLAINAVINPLTAILNVENRFLARLPQSTRGLIDELVAVARSAGVNLDAEESHDKVQASIRQTGTNVSSMLQDIRAGRRTEIDWINGAVVRIANDHRIPVPRHAQLLDLVRCLEWRASPPV